YARGNRSRALGYLWRAAAALPTSITPLLRIAQLSHEADDAPTTTRALDEAAARSPGNLALPEVCERSALPGPLSECEAMTTDARLQSASGAATSSNGRLDLVAIADGTRGRARWAAALQGLAPLHRAGAVLFDECVDATFGWPDPLTFERQVHRVPWVGC